MSGLRGVRSVLLSTLFTVDDHNRVVTMGDTDEDAYINGSFINVSV